MSPSSSNSSPCSTDSLVIRENFPSDPKVDACTQDLLLLFKNSDRPYVIPFSLVELEEDSLAKPSLQDSSCASTYLPCSQHKLFALRQVWVFYLI